MTDALPTLDMVIGDSRETLRSLEAGSVHTCVTSPPYFGLRDYNVDGQIGLEPTPDEFVDALVSVFRDVRDVLRDDGTLWLNLGDSYYSPTKGTGGKNNSTLNAKRDESGSVIGKSTVTFDPIRIGKGNLPLKQKDLIGIPWRVALALQADGWYLRQDIIWHKPNPMPESVRDRCTKAHEYIFLLSKSERYYFDNQAIQEPATCAGQMRGGSKNRYEQNNAGMDCKVYNTRNKRSVWSVNTRPFKGAHFATFPPDLIEPCVLAGCPVGGTVLDPFGGAGTTALVALKHRRNAILCELNASYMDIAASRIQEALGADSFIARTTMKG